MTRSVKTMDHTQISSEMATELSEKKRIGILGGTFNPPHIAHLVMADQVCQQLGLDKICFMPTYLPPHADEKKTIAAHHRVRMVEEAIKENQMFDIEKIEIERGGKSYTFDTMKQLTQLHPDTEYYFIIGGDMVNDLSNWYRIDELTNLTQFVGIRRPGFPVESRYPLLWVDVPQIDVSSTSLRNKISRGCTVQYLVPDAVMQYINREGLYKNEN